MFILFDQLPRNVVAADALLATRPGLVVATVSDQELVKLVNLEKWKENRSMDGKMM